MITRDATTPFMGALLQTEKWEKADIYLLGFPYDGSTSARPGTRFGAAALREASYFTESYSPYQDTDTEDLAMIDLGNLIPYPSRFLKMKEQFDSLSKKIGKKKLITIGGEHSISICPIAHYLKEYPNLLLIHLDAHADLRDGYLDDPYSHASVMFRSQELMNKNQNLWQYGIRSGTRVEFDWMKKHKTRFDSLSAFLEALSEVDKKRPIYLSLDLDFFDPSEFPGTGTPEAGGETFHNFIKLVKVLREKNFIGADIVELSPLLDASGNSSIYAAKVTREIILALTN